MQRTLAAVVLLFALGAAAQTPDDEWAPAPSKPVAPPAQVAPPAPSDGLPLPPLPAPSDQAPPPPPPPTFPVAPAIPVLTKPPTARLGQPVLLANTTNMTGGRTLGAGKRGQLVSVGFPLLEVRALFGVASALDLGVSFMTVYGMNFEFRGVARLGVAQSPNVQFALALEGGGSLFLSPASREALGARWLSGHRNYNVSPSAVVSFQTSDVKAAKVNLGVGYHLSFDTEPFAVSPLGGIPGKLVLGHSVLTRLTVEVPFSSATSFLVQGGLDFRLRVDEPPVYPTVSVGLVTSL